MMDAMEEELQRQHTQSQLRTRVFKYYYYTLQQLLLPQTDVGQISAVWY